ncbi:MAG: hypothetical protein JW941_07500, partial [Candidatus Coatesbacteria bacterium]|nr:hypothetical protein [Candidatus Coatesbacteria bacterium]
MKEKIGPSLLLAALLQSGAMQLPAAEYDVKKDGTGDFTAIQDAIDASRHGDVIVVHPGQFYENIRFNGKNIILRSTDPPDRDIVKVTIIDGDGVTSVITLDGTESSESAISGVTIMNGDADFGGGIRGNGAETTISHCSIEANHAISGGAVMDCDGRIASCTVELNSAINGA